MWNKHCACCGIALEGKSTGSSSLYNPGRGESGILLCEACFFEEDRLIEETGRNNMPDRLQQYYDNIERLG